VKSISRNIAMLVVTAAVLPLLVYGLVSMRTLRTGTERSVVAGNISVATRAAEQIEQYVADSISTLQAAGSEVHGTFLAPWQQERILRNFVLTFPAFRDMTLHDREGAPVASSRLSPVPLSPVPPPEAADGGPRLSPIQIDDDLLPKATVTAAVHAPGERAWWLVGELRLEEMWRVVDRLRIGEHGYALLIDERGRLIAHGDPNEKGRIARGEDVLDHPLARRALGQPTPVASSLEYTNPRGGRMLAVSAPLPSLRWTLIVEQPTREAYALALRLERLLLAAIGLAMLITVGAGYWWGRSLITPIAALVRGTRDLADGNLDTRVTIERADEFRTLGDAFNTMADRLSAQQAQIRKQERQAMFGRVAAGLVHDLSHPIQNIGNNCRLILKMYDDPEYREMFHRTVDRELQQIRRVLEDLRNLARPIPLERFPVDVARLGGEVAESMRVPAEAAGLELDYSAPGGPVTVEGDVFALGRVLRNLILNSIQATTPGGRITLEVGRSEGRARLAVSDTGCGIPPERLGAIFEDFVTTKRRGLGLGLPIARKIVEQLGGTIRVDSEVGRGTTFTIEFAESVTRDRGSAEGP
jgi:signal transduction histidine kinase